VKSGRNLAYQLESEEDGEYEDGYATNQRCNGQTQFTTPASRDCFS